MDLSSAASQEVCDLKYFVDIPAPVFALLEAHGVQKENLLYCAKADLDEEGLFVDTYLTFDNQNLYMITCLDDHQEYPGSFREIPLAQIQGAVVNRDIYSAVLLIESDEKAEKICRFSIGGCDMFEKFRDRMMKVRNHEPIDDSQLDEMEIHCPKCGMRYPDPNRRTCPKCVNKASILKRLLKMYKEFWIQALAVGLCILATTVLALISPLFSTKFLYDEVLVENGAYYQNVMLAIGLIVGTQVIGLLLSVVYGVTNAWFAPRMLHTLRIKIFSAMQPLSLSFFTSKQTGSLMARISHDTDYIYQFFIDVCPSIIINAIKIIGIIAALFLLNAPLSLIVLLVSLVTTIVITRFYKVQHSIWHKFHISSHRTNSYLSDVLGGQRVVKAFSRERAETERYRGKNEQVFGYNLEAVNREACTFPKVRGVTNAIFSLTFLLGAILILQGYSTLGALTAFLSYAGMIFEPINYFMWFANWWSSCVDASSRMFEILDSQPTIVEPENPIRKERLNGDISLKNVSFEYDTGRPIIKKVNLDIHAGEMMGIVGKTGAGKSTIINLISRMYDVTEGEITIDGENIKKYSFDTLRKSIGVVSQETYLFVGTIAENIGYAVENPSIEEIIRAAKSAFAHDFIARLTDGYDSLVGSGGISLSGGEKQRVSIARAILQSPSILILDEATSAMDTQTERRIQHAIETLRTGRTVISIAHRLSTLRDADRLAVIEHGELKELGTHADLIARKGTYFRLHQLQSESLKFIEMGADDMQQNVTSLYNLDDISEIKYITADNSRFTCNADGFLAVEFNGKTYDNIVLNRLLPFTDPESYISVQVPSAQLAEYDSSAAPDGPPAHDGPPAPGGGPGKPEVTLADHFNGDTQEIGIIKQVADLPAEQAELIRRQLAFRYYAPTTTKVLSIREKMSFVFIKAIFGDVEKEICVSEPSKNMRLTMGDMITITDVTGNRYLIAELEKMSKANRQKIDMYITI